MLREASNIQAIKLQSVSLENASVTILYYTFDAIFILNKAKMSTIMIFWIELVYKKNFTFIK